MQPLNKTGNANHSSIKNIPKPSQKESLTPPKQSYRNQTIKTPQKIKIPIKEISFIIQKSKKKVKQDETF